MKHIECKKHGDSLSDDDDDDNEEDSEREYEDPVALQSALDVLHGSGDGSGPSGTNCPMGVAIEESSTWKQVASSPSRGLSPKHPYATTDGG